MSIEQNIAALTLAVENLTKVIAGSAPQPAKTEKSAPKVEAPKVEAPTVYYDDVKKAVMSASTAPGGRTKVVDLLARYGCTKATELRTEQWADFIKELEAA